MWLPVSAIAMNKDLRRSQLRWLLRQIQASRINFADKPAQESGSVGSNPAARRYRRAFVFLETGVACSQMNKNCRR